MNSIRNFVQLTERIGTAGQPTESQFSVIAGNGYRHVINLAMPDHEDSIANEGAIVTSLGMSYLHVPVKFDQPEKNQVRLFCNLLSQIKTDRVFVHCIMNYRVSAFMFHYLSKCEGVDKETARSEMFDVWQVEPAWQNLLSWSSADLDL